jgi:hypothetical protein
MCSQAKQCTVPNTCQKPRSCSVAKTCKVSCSANPLSWGNCLKQVTDAVKCGTEVVVDGARCGYDTFNDVAHCGGTVVRDSVRCGTEYVKCGVDHVQCGTVSAAGAVCGTVCDGKIERGLGSFTGTVSLSIGTGGLSGSVEGDYEVNGTRTHLAGGRLDLTSTPKACITIPNGLGEFCHEF